MNKTQFVNELSKRTSLPKKMALFVLDNLQSIIGEELGKGNDITFSNFGRFKHVVMKSRKGVHPRTREPMVIPEVKTVAFAPSRALKDYMNDRN